MYERLGGSGFYDYLISATLERGNWNKWTGLYYISLLARLDLYFLSSFNGNRSIVFTFSLQVTTGSTLGHLSLGTWLEYGGWI